MAEPRDASTTARGVAVLRIVHQTIDDPPRILDDPVIQRLFGPGIDAHIHEFLDRYQSPGMRGLRSHVLLRSRFAEDTLHAAVERGAEQYILLGAGLDTFAYRQPEWARGIDIIEVDQPQSQGEKRRRLAEAGVEIPPNVTYVDVDFEHETLEDGLRRHGVAFDRVTVFSWLGVAVYLTREAIDAVLATVARFANGSEIVMTFTQPPTEEDAEGGGLAERAAAVGEPWISFFTPAEMHALLSTHGLSNITFLTRDVAMARYYANRTDGLVAPRRTSIVAATVGA